MYGVNDVEFISVERLAHEQDMWSIAGGGELVPYISHVAGAPNDKIVQNHLNIF